MLPLSEYLLLISGIQTCIYDCNLNSKTSESIYCSNAAFCLENKKIYTVRPMSTSEQSFTILENTMSLQAETVIQLKTLDTNNIKKIIKDLKIYKNILYCISADNSQIIIIDLNDDKIIFSANISEETIIYPIDNTIILIKKGQENKAEFEKGVLYNIKDYYNCLINDNKIDKAIQICLKETILQSLEIMEPLLMLLTRKKKTQYILDIEKTKEYEELLNLVTNVLFY